MSTIKRKKYAAKDHQEQGIEAIARKVSDILSEYKRFLLIVAATVAVILVITAGYTLYQSHQELKASPLVTAAIEQYAPSGGTTANYQQALDMFRDVQKKYPGTRSGAIAQYYIGNCLVGLGKTDEAINAYWAFINTYSNEKLLLSLAYQRLGYVYSMLGKQTDTFKAFEQAEAIGGPGVATVELARLYEASGNAPEAQKKYKLIMEKLGGTTWAMEAMGKVQAIVPAKEPHVAPAGK